ncbi:glycosyltransferase [Desulfovibrio sp. JC010]|uniref:glycosyltransferase family protein n=1 Tax=Desulfovibrio sp. JC010 TaxID=2593641 RepID=UPI0013D65836|nr:glycosyltransferase [Desulfovibrio sp. JC010]NDV25785.1 glycosyltransferase family 1 protein [Desulfovibrio sp. JC010]
MHKFLLINCNPSLVEAFKHAGCVVEYNYAQEQVLDLPAVLEGMQFVPDLIFQQEFLGKRILLGGLNELDCIKIFWSVDTHMNMHWHGYYADLFDCVLTTQKKFVPKLQKVCGAAVKWMPWMGSPSIDAADGRRIIPHTGRKNDLTFVGRVTSQRRSRIWFVDFLKSQYDLNLADGLSTAQMMEVYRNTRIVPNEALFGEVNFRLFEAASCGCAVVTPDIGEELGELFEVGREIEVYHDVLELKDILDRMVNDPSRSGALGLAAYERVLKDHSAQSRAESILRIAADTCKRKVTEQRTEFLLCLIEFSLGETGDPGVDWESLLNRLLRLERSDQRDAALLRIFTRSELTDPFMAMIRPFLDKSMVSSDCYFNMTASLCAAKLKLWDVAKHFWYAYRSGDSPESIARPENEVHLLVLWGDALQKCGLGIRSGVAFDEIRGIPSCASDCYFAALYRDPSDKEIYRRLDGLFRGVMGAEPSRLGFLSHLSLHDPDDWRISAEVGINNLKVFRIHEGLTELDNARAAAVRSGQERFYKRKIKMELPLYFKLLNS